MTTHTYILPRAYLSGTSEQLILQDLQTLAHNLLHLLTCVGTKDGVFVDSKRSTVAFTVFSVLVPSFATGLCSLELLSVPTVADPTQLSPAQVSRRRKTLDLPVPVD